MANEVHDSPRDWVRRHIDDYVASDGKGRGARRRLLLTTRGRRTGKLRRTALYFWIDGDDYFVVGSDAGSREHPAWYLNLTADPHVTVEVGGEQFEAIARTATADERPERWARVTEFLGAYEGFQARTKREIPIVILTPTTRNRA